MFATELEKMLGFDLRASWQVRALVEAKGQTEMVLLSVLSHSYIEQMPYVLTIAFPWYTGPGTAMPLPSLASAAKISKAGTIVADVITRDGVLVRDAAIYLSPTALQDDFRRLADHLKLIDTDRAELFRAVQNWIVADLRLDPNRDPKDRDAKRIIH